MLFFTNVIIFHLCIIISKMGHVQNEQYSREEDELDAAADMVEQMFGYAEEVVIEDGHVFMFDDDSPVVPLESSVMDDEAFVIEDQFPSTEEEPYIMPSSDEEESAATAVPVEDEECDERLRNDRFQYALNERQCNDGSTFCFCTTCLTNLLHRTEFSTTGHFNR